MSDSDEEGKSSCVPFKVSMGDQSFLDKLSSINPSLLATDVQEVSS